jgi:hypothetical protein
VTDFKKHDSGKPRFDLLPPVPVTDIASVLAFGAQKYAPGNWVHTPDWGRYYAAAQRHLHAWWGGEDIDAESGLPHLAHAGCCLLFLAELQRRGASVDNRPVP